MVRYELQPPAIVITAMAVTEVGDIERKAYVHNECHYRQAVLENNEAVLVLEPVDAPIKVGDLIRYEVKYDEYMRFDPQWAEQRGFKLVSVN